MNKKIENELEKIRKAHDGLLKPVAVVEYASSPSSVLHECFEWDDSRAAHQHRLRQARNLIVQVIEVMDDVPAPVQMYVSLTKDRDLPGGGYRPIKSVMTDKELRAGALADFWRDMDKMKKRYSYLAELAKVFDAVEKLKG